MDGFMFDRAVLNGLASIFVVGGAVTLLVIAWCILAVSRIQSVQEEERENNESIFDEEFSDGETVISNTVVRV